MIDRLNPRILSGKLNPEDKIIKPLQRVANLKEYALALPKLSKFFISYSKASIKINLNL